MPVRLGRRLVGRRDALQALAVVAAPVAVLLALFMTIHAFTLSPGQYSDLTFGRYGGNVELGGTSKTLTGLPPRKVVNEVMRDAPRDQSAEVVRSYDLRFGQLPRFDIPNYLEADWAKHPFGGRFAVLAGRMPKRPGEIVVAAGMFRNPVGRIVTAASGNFKLKITGVIQDRFARSSTDVLAAAGTWDSFDWRNLIRAGFSVNADTEVLGNFHHWSKLAELSARYQGNQGTFGGVLVTANNRATVDSDPPEGFVEREPLAYRAPATVLALLCPLLLLAFRGRRAKRWTAILRAMGVRPRRSAAAVMGGTIFLTLVAIPFGALAGELLGLLMRLVLSPLINEPLSPPASVLGETGRFAVLCMIMLAAVSLTTASRQRDSNIRELLARRPPKRIARRARLLGVLFVAAAIVFLAPGANPGDNTTSISILTALALCLLVPEALAGIRRASAGRGVQLRLVSNRLIIDGAKSCAVCAALIACIGPFVALGAENAAANSAQRSSWDYQLPLGQVAISKTPRAKFDRVDESAVKASENVAQEQPIEVNQITASRNTYASPPYAVVAPGGKAPELQPALLAVSSVAVLRDLLGNKLTATAAAVVARGGVLRFGHSSKRAPIGMYHYESPGAQLQDRTQAVPIASIPEDHAWSDQGSGFMLNSTARHLRLPMHVHLTVLDHINRSQVKKISRAVRGAGVPVQVLIQPRPFELDPEPAGLTYGRYGMLLLLAVLMTISLGSSARSLRKESRSLIAIGVRRSWAQQALVLQSITLTIVGVIGGIVAGAISMGIYAARLPNEPIVVPIGALATIATGSIAIAVAAASLASRSLKPRRSSQ